ncbi:uncharacterized protein TRIADDRAFT_55005 [Trichoplax adhaerens]|uniref:Uncharacterized protein n=1 Tax=Trichoplax adhaerens TaxID=10228 RepID=B3RQI8_TRIAD|nr:predicted protein [Trichoplax adhaerens]EDV27253.1 predicted protein [Trichoplax adhaerens]|eukprot:XP_002111249.1 predicted protein [Trichoplax adhaerens]
MSSLQAWIVLVIACWSTWQANLVIAGVIQSNLQTLPDHREKWANVAYNYIYSIQCQMLMSHRNCRKFRVTKRSDMNIYLAYHQGNSSYPEKYRLVLPRKQYESQKYLNDAIIVIDPFPKLSFGHRLFIFAIHGNLGQVECRARHGQYIGNKECLIMITKSECPNERESYKDYKRRCDTDILPLVYYANDLYTSQQLLCYSNFSGFGQCREVALRDAIPTPKDCQNSGTCHLGRASIQAQRTLECPRQYNPTENYAILLSSGWNDQTLSVHAESNVRRMWQALTRVHRYPVNHVQTFFGHYGVIDYSVDRTGVA